MSLLLFSTAPERVLIVTDTLATTTSGQARSFMSKCISVPHMNLAIAFTGIGQLGARWSMMIQEGIVSRDIDMLNLHTPDALRRLWRDLQEEWGLEGNEMSTVYHFGKAEESDRYVAYAYRSTNQFTSEQIPYGFGVKPPPLSNEVNTPDELSGWVDLAKQIRGEQDSRPAAERIYVGGALTMTLLEGGSILTGEIFRFEDFNHAWDEMNRGLYTDVVEV